MTEITSSAPQSRGPTDHNVRDQILEAAGEHFSRYGYDKTTVSDLAKAIGFSKAYIYKFFDSKQAIGEAICSKTLSAIVAAGGEALAGARTPSGKFPRMVKTLTATRGNLFFKHRQLHHNCAHPPGGGGPSPPAHPD